jgi:hypothetical protein
MGRNEDSLLRAADETALASATRGGSCAHPDQSPGLALRHKKGAISVSEHLLLILLFFIGGGVALHERLLSAWTELAFAGLEADLGTRVHKNRLLRGHAPPKNPLAYHLPVLIWSPLSRATRRLALSVLVGSVIIGDGFILVRQRFC